MGARNRERNLGIISAVPERKATDAFKKAERIGPDTKMQGISDLEANPDLMLRGEAPTPDMVRALGKPISELLGAIFTTPSKTGLPSKLRLTNWNAKTGEAVLHGVRKAGEEMVASPRQLNSMIGADQIGLQQPPEGAVAKIQALLARALGQ